MEMDGQMEALATSITFPGQGHGFVRAENRLAPQGELTASEIVCRQEVTEAQRQRD
jgi:hypothetical protein